MELRKVCNHPYLITGGKDRIEAEAMQSGEGKEVLSQSSVSSQSDLSAKMQIFINVSFSCPPVLQLNYGWAVCGQNASA